MFVKTIQSDGRLDVRGTITCNDGPFQGTNLTTIIFEPVGDPSSCSSTAAFDPDTGKYLCTMQDGLKPGKYRVRIVVQTQYDRKTNQPTGPDFEKTDEDDWKVNFVPLLPQEFNEKSTLEFEVVDGKKNVFDYDIKAELKPQ